MGYLSQASLPVPAALRAGLGDGYAWHRAMWEGFPDRRDAQRNFLFRVDRHEAGFRALLLSDTPPAATELLAWRTKEVSEEFLGHAAYRFQLKANPTMRRNADRRRLAIFDDVRLRDWLSRKAAASGFTVDPGNLIVGAPMAETFVKGKRAGKHVAVDFEGVLRVVDRDAFAHAFYTGIGSAKGFGYGLLMLKPIG